MRKHKTPITRHLRRLVQILVPAGLVMAVTYWFGFRPVPVAAHRPTRGEIVAEVMGTGTLEAHIRATVSPKISGLITKVAVDQGDRISAGQVLVQLDDRDLRRQVQIAEATLDAATAGLDRLRADRARAVAVLEQARREHDRLAGLKAANTASSVEYDRGVEALQVAEAELARADAAIVEGRKQVVSAEHTLEFHRVRLADAVIRAPFDGLVVRRDRDPGDVVVPGTSVLAVISMDELWISAWVDETEMARLRPGQPARVFFRSEPNHARVGEVARLGREADRETREFVVDVRVRELPDNWAVGQRAEVFIETARKANALLVPAQLILWKNGSSGVFVATADRARWRTVTVGLRSRGKVEVLEGLQPEDVVVGPLTPTESLADGQRIVQR